MTCVPCIVSMNGWECYQALTWFFFTPCALCSAGVARNPVVPSWCSVLRQ